MTDRARAEPRRLPSRRRGIFRTVAVLALAAAIALLAGCSADRQAVRVGAKDFTEQKVLAEMVAQLLETGGVPVSRIVQFPNGVTPLDAIGEGVVDAYVEYTEPRCSRSGCRRSTTRPPRWTALSRSPNHSAWNGWRRWVSPTTTSWR